MCINAVNKIVRIKIRAKFIKSFLYSVFFSLSKKLSISLSKEFILLMVGTYVHEPQKHAKNTGYLLNIRTFIKYSKSIGKKTNAISLKVFTFISPLIYYLPNISYLLELNIEAVIKNPINATNMLAVTLFQ